MESRVAKTVRVLMAHYGVTLTQVAEASDVKKSTLYTRMAGKPWQLTEIVQVAWALGVRGVDLIEGVDDLRQLPDEPPVIDVVRRQGLEPRTRWERSSALIDVAA